MGITLVEAVALLYMVLLYFRRRSLFQQLPQDLAQKFFPRAP